MEFFTTLLFSGIILGSFYALMALGLSLIFSILKIINFAHGEFYMFGGYFSYLVISSSGVPPIVAILVAMLGLFIIGSLFEVSFLRPIHKGQVERPDEYAILVTFGLSFFLRNLALVVFGPYPHRPPKYIEGLISTRFFIVTNNRLLAAAVALVLMVLLFLFIRKTWTGKAFRAISQDREAAEISGVLSLRMNTIAFGLGSALAAASGSVMASIFSLVPNVGTLPSIRSFVILVLGGMGSIPGAVLGGYIIGIVESLGAGYFPSPSRALMYKPAFALLVFALVLLIRPQGLFGEKV